MEFISVNHKKQQHFTNFLVSNSKTEFYTNSTKFFFHSCNFQGKTFLYKQRNQHESWQRSSGKKSLIDKYLRASDE